MILIMSVVIIGVAKLGSGKKNSMEQQNKLMMLRVGLQAIVVILIGIVFYFSK